MCCSNRPIRFATLCCRGRSSGRGLRCQSYNYIGWCLIAFAILYSHWVVSEWIEVKLYTESHSRLREASTWKSSVRSPVDVSRKVREQDGNLMSQISCDGEPCLNTIRGNIDLFRETSNNDTCAVTYLAASTTYQGY